MYGARSQTEMDQLLALRVGLEHLKKSYTTQLIFSRIFLKIPSIWTTKGNFTTL
jgi:hypothetical protein